MMGHRPGAYDAAVSGHNIVGWSPYEGIDLMYRPLATFLRGRMAFDGLNVISEPGQGAFVQPAPTGVR